jgi:hypothetical protein
MYAKVFAQIFDSSIADDFRLRHFFMDLLVLADVNGVVDMTPTAIAARTRIPLEDVSAMLAKLEQSDPESRTAEADGRRIERLDDHRTWGWHIINYSRFREIASEDQRRQKTRERVASFRQKRQQKQPCNAPVTPGNACNAMQKQKQKKKQKQGQRQRQAKSPQAPIPPGVFFQSRCPNTADEVFEFGSGNGCDWDYCARFIRFNNKRGWQIKGEPINSWQFALLKFRDTCDDSPGGAGDVPTDWIPEIKFPDDYLNQLEDCTVAAKGIL